MKLRSLSKVFLCAATVSSFVQAFAPAIRQNGLSSASPSSLVVGFGRDPANDNLKSQPRRSLQMSINNSNNKELTDEERNSVLSLLAMLPITVGLLVSLPATAATGDRGDFFPIASALAAYVHFAGLFCTVACLAAERVILSRDDFSERDENLLTKVDSAYGLFGIPVLVSGYYRVVQYGKGFDFYKHEPFFWLKIALAGVLAGASFFPTGTIIKRAIEKKDSGSYKPMSNDLQKRMTSVVNAELTGILFIPLTATLMARGVGYNESFPWQVEAGLAAVVFAGAAFKYVKEVLTWSDDSKEPVLAPEE